MSPRHLNHQRRCLEEFRFCAARAALFALASSSPFGMHPLPALARRARRRRRLRHGGATAALACRGPAAAPTPPARARRDGGRGDAGDAAAGTAASAAAAAAPTRRATPCRIVSLNSRPGCTDDSDCCAPCRAATVYHPQWV